MIEFLKHTLGLLLIGFLIWSYIKDTSIPVKQKKIVGITLIAALCLITAIYHEGVSRYDVYERFLDLVKQSQ